MQITSAGVCPVAGRVQDVRVAERKIAHTVPLKRAVLGDKLVCLDDDGLSQFDSILFRRERRWFARRLTLTGTARATPARRLGRLP
jgi:hypothetical protein